jgi:hypothetical protein
MATNRVIIERGLMARNAKDEHDTLGPLRSTIGPPGSHPSLIVVRHGLHLPSALATYRPEHFLLSWPASPVIV